MYLAKQLIIYLLFCILLPSTNTFPTITGLLHCEHKSLFIMQMIYMKILSVGYLNTRTLLYIRSSLALPLIICCLNMPSSYSTTFYCLFENCKRKINILHDILLLFDNQNETLY